MRRPGRQRLRQRRDEDDAVVAVEGFQRRLRRALVRQLALVVVLHQDHVGRGRALQQRVPALERHGHGGRELVARRHIGVVAGVELGAQHHALLVDADADHAPGMQRRDVARIGVAGILDAEDGVAIEQQVGDQIERVLRADRHQDLVGRHAHAAARQQARADLLDQQRIVVGEAVLGPVAHGGDAERLARALAPCRQREHALVDLAVDEGIGEVLPVGWLDNIPLRAGMKPEPVLPIGPGAHDGRLGIAGLLADIGGAHAPAQDVRIGEEPAALARDQEAFLHQILIGEDHGIPRDFQRLGERPAGRQRPAGRDLAVEDGRYQHAAQLRLQGRPLVRLKMKQKRTGRVAQSILPVWPQVSADSPGQLV